MKYLKEFSWRRVLLAAVWFASVYFTVSALFPALAFQAALLVTMAVIVAYLGLVLIETDEEGILIGLLVASPVICIAVGMAWWLMRVLGWWD